MKKTIATLGIVLMASTCFGDICELMSKDVAESALTLVKKGVILDINARENIKVKTVNVVTKNDEYMIYVNGEAIDLGYTNLVLNEDVALNLARIVQCDSLVGGEFDSSIGKMINQKKAYELAYYHLIRKTKIK